MSCYENTGSITSPTNFNIQSGNKPSRFSTRLKKLCPRPRGKSVTGKKITVNKYAYLHDRSCKSSEKKSLNKLFYFGLRLLSDEVIESYY